jgi:hypothetical protein
MHVRRRLHRGKREERNRTAVQRELDRHGKAEG